MYLINHCAMKSSCWMEAELQIYTGDRIPSTHRSGGSVDPRSCLSAMKKRKLSWVCRESNPGSQAHSHLTVLVEIFRCSLFCRDWEGSHKSSFRLTRLRAEIDARFLWNAKLESQNTALYCVGPISKFHRRDLWIKGMLNS